MNVAICPVERTDEFASGYQLTAFTAAEALADERLVNEWRQVLGTGRNRYTLFMSPEWIGHLANRSERPILIWVARDGCNKLLGVVPVARREFKLSYDIANRSLWTRKLLVAEVLGSQPSLPDSDQLLENLFHNILNCWSECDGIYFDALPADSFCSMILRSDLRFAERSHVYSPFGPRPSLAVGIETSFDDYLRTKSAKTRSTLRRKVRALEQSGPTRLVRYSNRSDVSEFTAGVSCVNARTWQNRLLGLQYRDDDATRARFVDLANRGLLRSYLLWHDERAFAYVVGYQYDGIYYYADVGFDSELAELSPGTVLLFLILQDLHDVDPPRALNFGVGDASYKQRFGKSIGSDETILVLRHGIRNRLSILAHRGFMAALNGVKRLVGRRVRK